MRKRILVPWAIPEIGKEVLTKAKAEIILIYGPKGELPSLKALIEGVRNAEEIKGRACFPSWTQR